MNNQLETKDKISIAKEFTKEPGARYKYEGNHSGELFLEILLRDRFIKALNENYVLEIDLDGVVGFPPSFVSGSFGVLSVEQGFQNVLNHISFKSADQEKIERFLSEVRNPKTRPRAK